jgi:hypothetical protein
MKEEMMKRIRLQHGIVELALLFALSACGGTNGTGSLSTLTPSGSDAVTTSTPDSNQSGSATAPNGAATTGIAGASYRLSVAVAGAGSVNSSVAGINCGAMCTALYASGTKVTLYAAPAAGYVFAGWSGACYAAGPSCIVTISGATSVSVSFESVTGTSESIDAVIAAMPQNSWKALPGTQMKNVCPAPYNSFACEAVISAWSGGAYDEKRDRMVVFGGGHYDSWYNNLFAFDLLAMKWYRLTEMSAAGGGTTPPPGWDDPRLETCGFYPKGPVTLPANVMNGNYVSFDKCFVEPVLSQLDLQQPRSQHTYGGLIVDRLRDRYCHIGTSGFYPSGQSFSPVGVCFDPSTGLWSRMADRIGQIGGRGQTALDSSGHFWSVAGEQGSIGEYDPIANAWKEYGYNNYDAGGGTDIDRNRNQLYVLLPGGSMRRWDLTSPASLRAIKTYADVTVSGDLPGGLGTRPGFVYADGLDRLFAWGGGRDIYTFAPVSRVWTRLAAAGDNPGGQQHWGTNGRFRYSPKFGVFVLVNSTTQNVFIYKP